MKLSRPQIRPNLQKEGIEMKRIHTLLSALLCMILLASPALGESGNAGWYELSNDDTVLTVRLPVEADSGAGWVYEISDPDALELLTMETTEDAQGAGGEWVASFAGTFERFGNVTLQLRRTSSQSAAYEISLFISENNQLQIVYAGDADRLQVRTTANVNLRSGAGLNFGILRSLQKDVVCTYLGESVTDDRMVDWYRVEADGVAGWVSSRYAQLEVAPDDPVADNPTDRIVEVTGEKVNLRGAPALNADALDILSKGDTLTYLNDSATDSRGVVWYYVRADGGAGWISSRYARLR